MNDEMSEWLSNDINRLIIMTTQFLVNVHIDNNVSPVAAKVIMNEFMRSPMVKDEFKAAYAEMMEEEE